MMVNEKYIRNINRWLGYKDSKWNMDRWKEYIEKMKTQNEAYQKRQRKLYFEIKFDKNLPLKSVLVSVMRFQKNGVKIDNVSERDGKIVVRFKRERK